MRKSSWPCGKFENNLMFPKSGRWGLGTQSLLPQIWVHFASSAASLFSNTLLFSTVLFSTVCFSPLCLILQHCTAKDKREAQLRGGSLLTAGRGADHVRPTSSSEIQWKYIRVKYIRVKYIHLQGAPMWCRVGSCQA